LTATDLQQFRDATQGDRQPLERLAEIVSASEPDVPSIATPLAHEQSIGRQSDPEIAEAERPRLTGLWAQRKQQEPDVERERDTGWEL
jgi:hypothetical protein